MELVLRVEFLGSEATIVTSNARKTKASRVIAQRILERCPPASPRATNPNVAALLSQTLFCERSSLENRDAHIAFTFLLTHVCKWRCVCILSVVRLLEACPHIDTVLHILCARCFELFRGNVIKFCARLILKPYNYKKKRFRRPSSALFLNLNYVKSPSL